MWFVSYLNPGEGTSSFLYEFDFLAPSLAVRREHGVLKPLDRSEGVLDLGSYVLAVRLRHEYQPNHWRDAAIIPVLRITVSETGRGFLSRPRRDGRRQACSVDPQLVRLCSFPNCPRGGRGGARLA